MSTQRQYRAHLFALVVTTLISTASLADAASGMVYVVPDKILAQNGRTRAQANKDCPRCEARWREAWAVEGTKSDSVYFRTLRQQTSRPDDIKSPATAKGQ